MTEHNNRFRICMIITAAVILAMFFAAICMGQFQISISQVFSEIFGRTAEGAKSNVHTVIFNIRIPRIVMALISGAGLAVSGAAFQSLFANPLATPDTLGVANGASFGAALGLLLGYGSFGVQVLALAFGIAAVALVFVVTRGLGKSSPSMIMLILAGLVISSLFAALVSLVKYVADPQDTLPAITFWLMGRFSNITKANMLLSIPFIAAGTILILLLRFRLNALSLSEDEAKAMGIDLKRVRIMVIIAASMTTAAVVSVCGVIGWVGLLIPHISRMLFGNDNRYVVPASLMFGAVFMLVIDTIARCVTAAEIPVSILTAVIGAPVFIILLRKTGGLK